MNHQEKVIKLMSLAAFSFCVQMQGRDFSSVEVPESMRKELREIEVETDHLDVEREFKSAVRDLKKLAKV
jgi:hypothetical protein